jgi:hypothetical protein
VCTLAGTQDPSSSHHSRTEQQGKVATKGIDQQLKEALLQQLLGHPVGRGEPSPLASPTRGDVTAWDSAAPILGMPRKQTGSNDVAKRLEALTLAARKTEEAQADALGLGAAKAHREEELRKAEVKRLHERKEERRQRDEEQAAATAASANEAMRLHVELQGMKGTQLDTRRQERGACPITTARVLAIATSLNGVKYFKSADVAPAVNIVFANLAEGKATTRVQLERLRVGTYCDPHPPLNKLAQIKLEFTEQDGAEPTADMLTKQLQGPGCTMTGAWRLGEHGKCEYPRNTSKMAAKKPSYFSTEYVGTALQITQEFLRSMDDEGTIELPSGKFRVAPLPPTGEFLVHLIVSAGEPDSLSGNLRAMTEMGLSQLEIELCLGRVVGKALEQAGTSTDVLSKYHGVLISSEVKQLVKPGGNVVYVHPRDPLVRPRAGGLVLVRTAPAALGSSDKKFGSPKLFTIWASVEAARRARDVIQEIRLQLPIGQGVHMTPAPEESSVEVGPAEALSKLQQQVNAARVESLTWMQEAHTSITALDTMHWNRIVNQKLTALMEAGRGLIVRAHPAVGSQLIAIFHQYDKDREDVREEQEWKILWQTISNLLKATEGRVSVIEMEVVHATIELKKVSIHQLFHPAGVFNPVSHMSALMRNVVTALEVQPVGMQYCVTSHNGVRKIHGLLGEAPFLHVRLWKPHIENLMQTLTFRNNKSSFVFSSLTGQEIQAQIRLLAEMVQEVEVPTNITQTMEMLLEAFERGIALFVPTVTADGTAIKTTTMLSDLQPLSEDQQKECPFDIRAWKVADGLPGQRLQAMQALIRNNQVSMVVSANKEQRDWTVYMANTYAQAINRCVDEEFFAWDDVRSGEDISDKVTTALQITFLNFLHEHARDGIYCSGNLAMEQYQGKGTGDDGPMLSDEDLALMPRSLSKLGRGHPFVSTNNGIRASQTLVEMVEIGKLKIIGKAGAGAIITEPLKDLVDTIQRCATTTMSPAMTTNWTEIPMTEHDFVKLTEKAVERLQYTKFVWLFADPEQLGTTPIPSLEMHDQARELTAQTVCKLSNHDARFLVSNWIFLVIHTLVGKGTLAAQAVVHRRKQRSGWIIVSPDKGQTLLDQYGDLPMITTKLKSAQLGEDDQARERLLELELERLEQYLDQAHDHVILVTGAEKREQGFIFTDEKFRDESLEDVNVITKGLARKTNDHQQATILHARSQGKIVLQVTNGVLLVPPNHALASWSQDDVRLQRWHPGKPLEELVQSARAMDQDKEHEEQPHIDLDMGEEDEAPAEGEDGFTEQVKKAIAAMNKEHPSQVLTPIHVEASSHFGNNRVENALKQGKDEWVVGLDYKDQSRTTFVKIQFERRMEVTAIGTLPRQGPGTRIFTEMQVHTLTKEMPGNRIALPNTRDLHLARLPQSFISDGVCIVFDIVFDKKGMGKGSPPGLQGLVVLGQQPKEEEASNGVIAMMKRAAVANEGQAAGHPLPVVDVQATSYLGDAFGAGNVCKEDPSEWAVAADYESEEGPICLTVTLAKVKRVAAIALAHRDSQESKETKVFTSVCVQSPDLAIPGNLIDIPQDRRLHEFLLPNSFVGQHIQLVFDRRNVAGNGEPPGLCGLLVYGHEPDGEINAQGGRDGHKKGRK